MMKSHVKGLGALVCALGVTNARLPFSVVGGAVILQHPNLNAMVNSVESSDAGPMVPPEAVPPFQGPPGAMPPYPGPPDQMPPFVGEPEPRPFPPGEMPPPPPCDYPSYSPSMPIAEPAIAIDYMGGWYGDVQQSCWNDFLQFCAPAVEPQPEAGSVGDFYTATTKIIFAAARKLRAIPELEAPSSSKPKPEHPFRPLSRGLHTHGHGHGHKTLGFPEEHHKAHGWDHAHMHEKHRHEHEHMLEKHHHEHEHMHEKHHPEHEHMHHHDDQDMPPMDPWAPYVDPAPCNPPAPIGFGPEADMCLRNNFPSLSYECQEAIKRWDESEDVYSEPDEYEYDEDEHEHMLGHIWLMSLFWVTIAALTCKCAKRRKERRLQLNAVLNAVHNDGTLKAMVESAAGVEVPQARPVRSCCLFLGPVIVSIYAGFLTLVAICLTTKEFSDEDSDGAEVAGWVVLSLAGVLLLVLALKMLKKLRCSHCQRPYSYNGPNQGYIALTGSVRETHPSAPESEAVVYTGIPVPPPGSVAAPARAYNPPNVV